MLSPEGLVAQQPDIIMSASGRHGTRCREIRRLDPATDPDFQRMLARLDAHSRQRPTHPAGNSHQLSFGMIGIYVEHTLAGALALYDCAHPGRAHVAFAVDPQWRRRGLGWALLNAATRVAADARANHLRLIFSRQNWAMRQIARKADARLDLLMGEICADIAITPAGPKSSLVTT